MKPTPKPMRVEEWFAVVQPNGHVYCVEPTATACRQIASETWDGGWPAMRKAGYRIEPALISSRR